MICLLRCHRPHKQQQQVTSVGAKGVARKSFNFPPQAYVCHCQNTETPRARAPNDCCLATTVVIITDTKCYDQVSDQELDAKQIVIKYLIGPPTV